MKNLNVKAALVLSLLAFSACDKGGGGGNNNPQVVSVPGVTLTQYSVYPGESCIVNSNNTYTCTVNGQAMSPVGFDSLQTFCNNVINDQLNGFAARSTRQQMYSQQCSGSQNNGFCGYGQVLQNGVCVNNTGVITPGTGVGPITNNPDMKTVACRLAVKKGNAIGDTGLMQVQVIQNSASGVNMFAFTNATYSKKFLGIFNVHGTKFSNSEKLAKVKMYYTKETGKADMIKLEASGVDGDLTASVTGFAGSETKLLIAPQDEYGDATSIEVSCQAQGATTGNVLAYSGYNCKGEEKDGKKTTPIDYTSAYTEDLMNESYDVTRALKLHTEGTLATDAGSVSYEQIARYGMIDSSVSTRANITTPSKISVARSGYRLNLECKPVVVKQ